MKKIFRLILCAIVFLATACLQTSEVQKEMYYYFDDVVIKRIDIAAKTTLYYMEDGVPVDSAWVKYPGFVSSFNAGIYFKEDKSVVIDGGSGWKRKSDKPYRIKFSNEEYPEFKTEDTIANDSICVSTTDAYCDYIDSLKKQGRKYLISAGGPEYEQNRNRRYTKVRPFYKKTNPDSKEINAYKLLVKLASILDLIVVWTKDIPPVEMYYSFEDILIKRVGNKTRNTLYYMKDGVPIDSVWYEPGKDKFHNSDLFFQQDGTVAIIEGSWQTSGNQPKMFKIEPQTDFPEFIDTKIINGDTLYAVKLAEYRQYNDSMINQGRKYIMNNSSPRIEGHILNYSTKTIVETHSEYPL